MEAGVRQRIPYAVKQIENKIEHDYAPPYRARGEPKISDLLTNKSSVNVCVYNSNVSRVNGLHHTGFGNSEFCHYRISTGTR